MLERTFRVDNLACPACASGAEAALARQGGVAVARLSFTSGRLRVRYDGERLSEARIVEILRGFGLEARRVA